MTEEIKSTITDEQVTKIYNDLSKEDETSTKNIENAETETNNSNYEKSEEINSDKAIIPGIDVQETNDDYRYILSNYDVTEDEVVGLIDLISRYKNNEDIDYYENLPKSFKDIADGFRSISLSKNYKMSKNESAKLILKELVNDAQISNTVDTFQSELNETVTNMNKEYDKIMLDAFDETFKKIDEIELKDPEQAKKIRTIKKAFDEALTFDKQREYINSISAKKLAKFTKHYSRETLYFNKLVNVTDVKIPDIRALLQVIHNNLPQFEIEDIKKFITAICKSSYDLQVDKNIEELAYIYKMVSSIYKYNFVKNYSDDNDEAKTIFGNIADVITTCIINK